VVAAGAYYAGGARGPKGDKRPRREGIRRRVGGGPADRASQLWPRQRRGTPGLRRAAPAALRRASSRPLYLRSCWADRAASGTGRLPGLVRVTVRILSFSRLSYGGSLHQLSAVVRSFRSSLRRWRAARKPIPSDPPRRSRSCARREQDTPRASIGGSGDAALRALACLAAAPPRQQLSRRPVICSDERRKTLDDGPPARGPPQDQSAKIERCASRVYVTMLRVQSRSEADAPVTLDPGRAPGGSQFRRGAISSILFRWSPKTWPDHSSGVLQ